MTPPTHDEDEAPVRFIDEPGSDAGALLSRVPEPAPWSTTHKQRVRAAIDARLAASRRRVGRTLAWSAVAAAAFAAGVVVGHRRLPRPAVALAESAAPATPAPEAPLVVASGRAELRGDRVVVGDGRVVVAARSRPVTVEVPSARTRVRAAAQGVVEVRVLSWRVQVSAYRGTAEIETAEQPLHLLAPGRTLDGDGERALAPATAAEIERALDGVAAPEPPPPAPAPPVVPAHVERAPHRHVAPAQAPLAVAVVPAAKLPFDDEPQPASAPPPASPSAPPPVAVLPPVPLPAPQPVDAPSHVAAPPPSGTLPPPTVPAPPLAPTALAREGEALRAAVQRLRHEHDPAGALVLLDAYLREHPRGVLRTDAELARIDALLQTGDGRRALAALDRLSLDALPRARALHVTRGELRAEAGRCKDALADLALASDGADALAERALYREAACRAQLGDAARARAGLESYLGRFPHGRFASEARRALAAP